MSDLRKHGSRIAIAVLLLLTSWSGACLAAGLKDGIDAFDRADYKTAFATLRPLAIAGDVSAQYTLGIANYNGLGVPVDYPYALKWFELAAAQGFGPAEYCIAVMYAQGQALPLNKSTAVDWYKRAAATGYPAAFYNLGVRYSNGDGVRQDPVSGLAYFLVAVDLGVDAASERRDMFLANLKPEQVAAAVQLAKTLIAGIKHSKPVLLPRLQ